MFSGSSFAEMDINSSEIQTKIRVFFQNRRPSNLPYQGSYSKTKKNAGVPYSF